MLTRLKKDLWKRADLEKAKILSRFFKTGKGEYAEGDRFLGIMVPHQRKIAKQYSALPLRELKKLLASKVHEHRLVALLILIIRYQKADEEGKREIFDLYLKNTARINNWDLVDLSAQNIVGDYLLKRDRSVLYRLARSDNLWERRIAIMSTFAFIKKNHFEDTLDISEMLLGDRHDLIHKAVGWMLREVGKRDEEKEEEFLKSHYKEMPRTMLRYAIERFEASKRRRYLSR